MGYERDPDQATRGAGAIAALDRPGGRRDRQRLAVARATIQRDRAMAAVGRGALGRVDLRTAGERKVGGGALVRPAPAPPLVKVAPIPSSRTPPGAATMTDAPMTRYPDLLPPPPMPPVLAPGETPPIIASVPTTIEAMPRSAGGGMSSGAGTVMPTGSPRPTVQVDPLDPVDLPEVPETLPTSGGNTTRNLVLVGGGALALYLLFRKRGRR